MQTRLGDDIVGRGRRVRHRDGLRRHPGGARNARFECPQRPSHPPPHQPLDGKGAAEHQHEFPRDIEQQVVIGRIGRGVDQPIPQCRKVRNAARRPGDFTRRIGDPAGNLQQQLRAETVGTERRHSRLFGDRCGGFRCRRRLRSRSRRRRGGNRAQGFDHLLAFGIVLQGLERTARLIRRQGLGRGLRRRCGRGRRTLLGQRRSRHQQQPEDDERQNLSRHKSPLAHVRKYVAVPMRRTLAARAASS